MPGSDKITKKSLMLPLVPRPRQQEKEEEVRQGIVRSQDEVDFFGIRELSLTMTLMMPYW